MIHYHGAPISGGTEAQLAFKGKHVMVSYADASALSIVAEICQSFVIDNGAFSAWKSERPFDVEGFGEFVTEWHRHPNFDWYVVPDVIDGGVEANHIMRAKWFNTVDRDVYRKGVPVWHLDEPLKVLRELLSANDTIAFGSAGAFADVGSKAWWGKMSEAMKVCTDEAGRPLKNMHGLRMLDPDVFSHIPLKSADSTNVARNAGIDSRWKGPYAPQSRRTRALLMMERIEHHAAASRWNPEHFPRNWELFG